MPSGPPVSDIVLPSHIGELLEAVATGLGSTKTWVVVITLKLKGNVTINA
jgi:hypothetical protein